MVGSAPRPEIPFRYRKILYAVITEYIATGEPVGSRKLARRYGLNLSPASIRNVLADLEEMGYLSQPHTSAGRVPTDLGFRVFVDALVQMREVTAEDREAIVSRLRRIRPGDDVIRETGKLLASLTGAAAVVTPPRAETDPIAQIRFIPLRDGELLAVVVTRSGVVQNRVVPFGSMPAPEELDRIHNYLAELIGGRTLDEVREALALEMASERGQYDQLRRRARDLFESAVATTEAKPEVLIEGQGRLFGRPEFSDAEKIRGYLRAFEEKERLLELLDRTLAAGGVNVLIGSETNLTDVHDISVISAVYRGSGSATGTVGVIGPTRMDYAKVVPLVGFTARVMSDILERDGKTDEAEDAARED